MGSHVSRTISFKGPSIEWQGVGGLYEYWIV